MSVNERLTATYQSEHQSHSCTSASSSVKLTTNEHVWVLMNDQYSRYQVYEDGDLAWITFTGTLIQVLQ
ncbi:hypothetical protein DPMN_161265 [Dreissena polymorpha]|nr:hypothetical protein DPMN_161265 [Dreissena polymorpha]